MTLPPVPVRAHVLEEMREQADNVTRYYDEIDRRVGATGMDGIVGLLTISQHVESALAVVASSDLDEVVAELRSLLERLVRVDAQLSRLRALKTNLAHDDEVY
jgi:hypothetical protein